MEEQSTLVVVWRSADFSEAHLMASHLEAEGIRAAVFDDQTTGVMPLYVLALGGVRVMVSESDLQRAREILGLKFGE